MFISQQTLIADRFKLEALIGHGGMGEVYRALDQETGELVAIKRLKPELIASNPNFVERFAREGEALRQLNHPNIVSMVTTLTDSGEHYLVMEFVPGGSLADLLQGGTRLAIERAVRVGLDLADALTRAHRLNIIHRDLKPANVLLAEDGTARLTDFGIARIEDTTHLTQSGMVIGTYAYMSPELCNGDRLDTRTDIWSFGVILYEMLAGRQPFAHPQLMHLLKMIMNESPPDLQRFRPEVSDALADLIYRMLMKDRSQRIPSARLVGAELEAILRGKAFNGKVWSSLQLSSRFGQTTIELSLPRHNLSLITTPFVGREAELAEIGRLLKDANCRLLTVHGPGGIGKTRLAIQAGFNHLEQFQQGVYFVDLSLIQDPDLIIPAIADAIQFNFSGGEEPEVQLLNYLQNKEMLLVMDNFEQLIGRAELLAEILQAAPQVSFLVTSRERLNLREEWLLPLEGLPVPEEIDLYTTTATSIQLFLQTARRVQPGFSTDEEDLQAILRICQLVEGMPLGIELAAAWINVLTPAEITEQIGEDFDFLTTTLRDLPTRHHSLRAVFEYSWQLLDEEEQSALRRLSVFRGGFSREAARQVAKASLLTLNNLINKSLLRRAPVSGRYDMQDLLRQFTAEKLAGLPEEEIDAANLHAQHYLHFLQGRLTDLTGGRQPQALAEIDQEIGNVRAAWQWAVTWHDREALALAVDALYHFYQLRGRQREGAEVFGQAARALRVAASQPDLILAQLLARQGACSRFIGRLDEAKALLKESLALARSLQNKREIAFSLIHLGATNPSDPAARAYWQESLSLAQEIGDRMLMAEACNWLAFAAYRDGDFSHAVELLEKSLSVRRALKDQHGLAISLTNLAIIYAHIGEHNRARDLLQEGLRAYQQLNDLYGVATAYINLSYNALNTGDYVAAEQFGEQALEYLTEVGDKRGQGRALGNLGEVALYQEEYDRAREIFQQCITLYREIGLSTSSYHGDLGRVALAQGRYDEAEREFREALRAELNPSLALNILTGIAAVWAYTGEAEKAVALLTFIRQHPAAEQPVKDRAAVQLAHLKDQLSPEQLAAGESQGKGRTLSEWIEFVQEAKVPELEGNDQ